jgi:hypothetical protein
MASLLGFWYAPPGSGICHVLRQQHLHKNIKMYKNTTFNLEIEEKYYYTFHTFHYYVCNTSK